MCVCVEVGWGVAKWEGDWKSGSRFYFLLQGQEKARVMYENRSCQTGLFSLAAKKLNTPVTPKISTFGAETFTFYCSVKSLLLTMRKKKTIISIYTAPKTLSCLTK